MKHRQRHIYLATPVHGDVCAEYLVSLINTLPLLVMNGLQYTHAFVIGNSLVHDARNRLAAQCLASEATDLLFIDSDIGWDPHDMLRLAISPHDVIGGAYRQKRDDVERYNVGAPRRTATDLYECDYLGTGMLKISRRALEKLVGLHPEWRYTGDDGLPMYGLFQSPIEGGRITGEDAFFQRHWRATGGKVFVDPDMTLLHVGRKPFEGNFRLLIERERAKHEGRAA